ncbi:DUF350 domain-containing protein [Gordonia desulfuricans]|uniref:DUF350 domain-containing protein n=1 Tax=Gordonia desulfuricans TaxID=89051 RepID=A0A7K3LVK9_9ACTN|nr:DUF350 domain-containing protein [Gordonia desulfuricans]NDK92126.1 DUF350 domain-containing protein [Gordonia desulfuricans]
MEIVRDNLAAGASYSLVGIALLVIGFVALDLVTPGRLRQLVWAEQNRNAVLLTASMVIGLVLVMMAGVIDGAGLELWRGLVYTIVYVVVAIAVMMWSFVLIDWLTPGKLGTLLLEENDDAHPAGWITATVFVGIGAIIAAAVLV